MISWRITFLILSIVCFASFTWAIKKHFRPTDQQTMAGGMRLISILGLLSFFGQIIAIWFKDEFNILTSVVGCICYLTSLSLFYWAVRATLQYKLTLAYSTDEPQFLLKTGPYGFIRHPFYLAYSIYWVAGFVTTQNWWLILPIVAMFWLYYQAAKMEEMKFFGSINFHTDYNEYRKQTGMFLPKLF